MYPSEIFPAAEYLDKFVWDVFVLATGQQVSRKEQGLGFVFLLNIPVDTGHTPIQKLSEDLCLPEQTKACGAPCWSQSQELAQNMELVGPSFKGRINRSPPSSARSWMALWQLVQQCCGRGQQTSCTYRAVWRSSAARRSSETWIPDSKTCACLPTLNSSSEPSFSAPPTNLIRRPGPNTAVHAEV